MKNAMQKYSAGLLAMLVGFVSNSAMAVVSYTDIVDAADWDAASVAVIAVFGAIAIVLVALAGGRLVLSAFRK